jgi:imidazolonepropionase-like amidohydrolase
MPLGNDYQAMLEAGLRNKVAIAVSQVVMTAVGAATPPPEHLNLARKFMLSPESEVDRYLMPIVARLVINGVTIATATDAQIITATQQVLAVNAQLGIGVT